MSDLKITLLSINGFVMRCVNTADTRDNKDTFAADLAQDWQAHGSLGEGIAPSPFCCFGRADYGLVTSMLRACSHWYASHACCISQRSGAAQVARCEKRKRVRYDSEILTLHKGGAWGGEAAPKNLFSRVRRGATPPHAGGKKSSEGVPPSKPDA